MADERSKASRVVIAVLAGSVVLGAAAGSVGGTAIAIAASTASEPGAPVAAEPSASSTTDPTAVPSSTAAPVSDPALGHALPASCEALYSPGMLSTLAGAGVVLNPAWLSDPEVGGPQYGTLVDDLQHILATPDKLTCTWTNPGGGSEVGLTTEVVQVTADQAAEISAKLASIGWTRLDELGGVRWVVQRDLEGNAVGESQFVRDGLWFATQYLNLPINGYTADMVTTVFG
jgi:hypothetical protein